MTNNNEYVVHYSEPTKEFIILEKPVPVDLRVAVHPLQTYATFEEAKIAIDNPIDSGLSEKIHVERDLAVSYLFNNYISRSIGYAKRIGDKVRDMMDRRIDDYVFTSGIYRDTLTRFVDFKLGSFPTPNIRFVKRSLEHLFDTINIACSNNSDVAIIDEHLFKEYFGLWLLNCQSAGAVKESMILSDGILSDPITYVINLPETKYDAIIEESDEGESVDINITISDQEEIVEKPSIADAVETIHSAFNEEDPTSEKAYDIIKEGLGEEAADALMEMVSDSPDEELEEVADFIDEERDDVGKKEEHLTESQKLEEVLGVVIPELEKNLMDKPVEELGPKEMRLVINKLRRYNSVTVGAIYGIPTEKVKAISEKWNSKFSSEEERDARLIELWNEAVPNADIKDECHIVNDAELKSIAKRLDLGRKLNKPITVQEIDLNKPEYQQAIELYKENRTYADIRLKTGLSQHYLNKVFEEAIKQGLIEPRAKEHKSLGKTHTLTEIAHITNHQMDEVKMYCLAHNIRMTRQGRGFVISDEDFTAVVSGMAVE